MDRDSEQPPKPLEEQHSDAYKRLQEIEGVIERGEFTRNNAPLVGRELLFAMKGYYDPKLKPFRKGIDPLFADNLFRELELAEYDLDRHGGWGIIAGDLMSKGRKYLSSDSPEDQALGENYNRLGLFLLDTER